MDAPFEKVRDVVVYRNEQTYVAPIGSVEILSSGDIAVSFREAKRRRFRSHIDPTSRAVMVRSRDGGESWDTAARELIYDDPRGIQDPCLRRLRDGTLIASFFAWRLGSDGEVPDDCPPGRLTRKGWDGVHHAWTDGTYVLRSFDNGLTWERDPIPVTAPTGKATLTSDAILELPDGELLVPLYGKKADESDMAFVMRSRDKGRTWTDLSVVAFDPFGNLLFMEPSLVALPSGNLLCMMRVHRNESVQGWADGGTPYFLYQSESADLGRSWSLPRRTEMWGHPPHLLRLASGSILCTYGHRRRPYGVRACRSRDGGTSWDIQEEYPLSSMGTNADFGYPSSVQLADGTIFTAWYYGCDGYAQIHGAFYRERA